MKRIYFLAAALLFCGTVTAQKLSPNTQLLMLKPAVQQTKSYGKNNSMTPVKAFVTISDPSAIRQIEQLGGTVHAQVTPTTLTAALPLEALADIAAIEEVVRIQAASAARPLMDVARQEAKVEQAHAHEDDNGVYTGKDIIVGIVDTGFEYGHLGFYSPDGKTYRVKRVWNQTATAGRSPERFGYGTEYTNEAEILAARYDNASSYHGTHVTGIAAGGDKSSPYYGVAPEADLVLVSFGATDMDIVNGVKYIFDYAESVGKPCVVNLSLGQHYGPHDGTSAIDRAFDELAGPGRLIVGACGNEGQNKLHAGKVFTSTDTQFKTMIGYSSESASTKQALLDIWGSVGGKLTVKGVVVDALKGKIVAQTDEIASDDPQSQRLNLLATTSGVEGYLLVSAETNSTNDRPNISIETVATSIADNRRLGIIVTGREGEEVHLWNCLYGDMLSGNKAGWTGGDTDYTIGEIGGTGKRVISVGSYNTKSSYKTLNGDEYYLREEALGRTGAISAFSSIGPSLDGRIKPDVAAPGALIISATSKYTGADPMVMAAVSTSDTGNSYYYDVEAGTSMSSPFVAGTVALWLQANPTLTPEQALEIIGKTSRQDTYTGRGLPNNTWGAGKIDVYAGLLEAIKMPTAIKRVDEANTLMRAEADRSSRTLRFLFADQGRGLDVALYNAQGRLVRAFTVAKSGESMSTASLASGMYVVKMSRNGYCRTVKVVL